jgi:hypothetical protein
MSNTIKVLGQLSPSAASLSTLYTVPALTSAVCSSIVICNQSATPTTFRIAIRPAGASIDPKHYIYYNVAINGNDTFVSTIGISFATADVISVYATLATVSFNVFGQESS